MHIFDPQFQSLVLMLYTGPDQMLPILSFLGAILGILLMWWRRLVFLVRKVFKPHTSEKSEVTTKTPE